MSPSFHPPENVLFRSSHNQSTFKDLVHQETSPMSFHSALMQGEGTCIFNRQGSCDINWRSQTLAGLTLDTFKTSATHILRASDVPNNVLVLIMQWDWIPDFRSEGSASPSFEKSISYVDYFCFDVCTSSGPQADCILKRGHALSL